MCSRIRATSCVCVHLYSFNGTHRHVSLENLIQIDCVSEWKDTINTITATLSYTNTTLQITTISYYFIQHSSYRNERAHTSTTKHYISLVYNICIQHVGMVFAYVCARTFSHIEYDIGRVSEPLSSNIYTVER